MTTLGKLALMEREITRRTTFAAGLTSVDCSRLTAAPVSSVVGLVAAYASSAHAVSDRGHRAHHALITAVME
jgi:hypothetical protein